MRIGTLPIIPFSLPLTSIWPKLFLMLRGSAITPLSEAQMADMQRRLPGGDAR